MNDTSAGGVAGVLESLPVKWHMEANALDKSFSPGSGIMAAERRARALELEAALAAIESAAPAGDGVTIGEFMGPLAAKFGDSPAPAGGGDLPERLNAMAEVHERDAKEADTTFWRRAMNSEAALMREAANELRRLAGEPGMKRPAEMPKVGTTIHDPLFGGGCTLRVTKVHKPGANRGWRVTVHITTDDGRRITMPTRVWSLASWIDSVSRATAAHAQACAMHGPSGRSPSDLTFGAQEQQG